MKNYLLLIALLAVVITLSACSKKPGKGEDGQGSRDIWDLTVGITEFNNETGDFTINFFKGNEILDGELISGQQFRIERLDEKTDKFVDYPTIIDSSEICWTQEGWIIKNDEDNPFKQNYNYLYGVLPEGRYQLVKEVILVKEPGNLTRAEYKAAFEIREEANASDVGSNDLGKEDDDEEFIETSYDYEASVKDNEDGTYTLYLSGNPTTGYEWTKLEIGGNIPIELTDSKFISVNEGKSQEELLVGAGGIYEFTVKVDSSKSESADLGYITFQYKRSWEEKAIANCEFTFIVDDNGNLFPDIYK